MLLGREIGNPTAGIPQWPGYRRYDSVLDLPSASGLLTTLDAWANNLYPKNMSAERPPIRLPECIFSEILQWASTESLLASPGMPGCTSGYELGGTGAASLLLVCRQFSRLCLQLVVGAFLFEIRIRNYQLADF